MRLGQIVAAFLLLGLGACASVTEGTHQSITVNTPGVTGAACTLSTPSNTYHVTTPGSVSVSKEKANLDVICVKDGYADGHGVVNSGFEGMTAGNILIGGLIGVGIDAATGAINKYAPSTDVVMLPRQPGDAPAASAKSEPGAVPASSPPSSEQVAAAPSAPSAGSDPPP